MSTITENGLLKVTDYIVEFLRSKGINDFFGYPGGVICHFIDSASKYPEVNTHINYNEQGSAFAACGYAQSSGRPGVAFATSGPGATNLLTGIANAYFDSVPCIFLTGQVDTYALSEGYPVRQRGFQETNVVSMVKDISKWAIRIDAPNDIRWCMEKAYYEATSGNPGPVVLDLPADVQRAEVDVDKIRGFKPQLPCYHDTSYASNFIIDALSCSRRPVFLLGNGVKLAGLTSEIRELIEKVKVPIVSSLPAFDVLPFDSPYNYGFIGTNGHRYANFLLSKADLIVSIGSRLDIRQIGLGRDKFALQAKLIRIDIDEESFAYRVRDDEVNVCVDLREFIPSLLKCEFQRDNSDWLNVCAAIKSELIGFDDREYNLLLSLLSKYVPNHSLIALDVGQHQLWFAQSFKVKDDQQVYMSSGHGAMGYSLPAAIGLYYASHKTVFVVCGDGGLMMNVQELQFIKREHIPIKIVCVNNASLGMIRGFQERNFACNYQLTTEASGYLAPDLDKIAYVFDMNYSLVQSEDDMSNVHFNDLEPGLIELRISKETVLEPNFGRTGSIQDQMPYMDRGLFNRLMSL